MAYDRVHILKDQKIRQLFSPIRRVLPTCVADGNMFLPNRTYQALWQQIGFYFTQYQARQSAHANNTTSHVFSAVNASVPRLKRCLVVFPLQAGAGPMVIDMMNSPVGLVNKTIIQPGQSVRARRGEALVESNGERSSKIACRLLWSFLHALARQVAWRLEALRLFERLVSIFLSIPSPPSPAVLVRCSPPLPPHFLSRRAQSAPVIFFMSLQR